MEEKSNTQTPTTTVEQKTISLQEVSILLTEIREFFNNPNMTILGSTALKLHGLNVNIHDVDILIEYSSDCERQKILDKLLLFEKMTNSKDVFHSDSGNHKDTEGRWCFLYKGVKIDIWLRKSDLLQFAECKNANKISINPYIWYNYMKVQPILTVLKYKKQYARPKDFIVIEDLAAQILKKNE